jgi:HEAT repeat protein
MHGSGDSRFLVDVATDASQPLNVRKQALFWASQEGGLSVAELSKLYDASADKSMREQILFAMSQRKDAVDKLLEVARTEKDPSLRSKAIFWLGQSRDPRAAKVLQEIINQ